MNNLLHETLNLFYKKVISLLAVHQLIAWRPVINKV